jgi:hypothetical protein
MGSDQGLGTNGGGCVSSTLDSYDLLNSPPGRRVCGIGRELHLGGVTCRAAKFRSLFSGCQFYFFIQFRQPLNIFLRLAKPCRFIRFRELLNPRP